MLSFSTKMITIWKKYIFFAKFTSPHFSAYVVGLPKKNLFAISTRASFIRTQFQSGSQMFDIRIDKLLQTHVDHNQFELNTWVDRVDNAHNFIVFLTLHRRITFIEVRDGKYIQTLAYLLSNKRRVWICDTFWLEKIGFFLEMSFSLIVIF